MQVSVILFSERSIFNLINVVSPSLSCKAKILENDICEIYIVFELEFSVSTLRNFISHSQIGSYINVYTINFLCFFCFIIQSRAIESGESLLFFNKHHPDGKQAVICIFLIVCNCKLLGVLF